MDCSKIKVIIDWPVPTSVTELRGFLDLTGYYRKFLRDYGGITRLLTTILRKGKFAWDDAAEEAFQKLKLAMTTTPTLALPNFSQPFVIEIDASGDGIGVALSQNHQPIAFMSRSLSPTKKLRSTYAREMLHIIMAIRTWRPYLVGRKFTIQTDQRSLWYMLEQHILTLELQKWMSKLVGYNYDIVYKPGCTNSAADALSWIRDNPLLHAISQPRVSFWEYLRALTHSDPYLLRVGTAASDKPGHPYSWKDGLVRYTNRIVIPPSFELVQQLLHEHHNTAIGGHTSISCTFKHLSQQFYWLSMHISVADYVARCETCQCAKAQIMSLAGLLQPLPIPEQLSEDVWMDFVDGLPKSNGYTSILVVVDRLTESAHLVPLSHPYTTAVVAANFVEYIVKLHGLPRSILSDRDPIFFSIFWKELLKLQGTTLHMSSVYHP